MTVRRKIMGRDVLRAELEARRASALSEGGRIKVVFTNGCFDIIHVGHVSYLGEAASLGDILVVGLNSDSSVATIKPGKPGKPGRPIMPEAERAIVLAALEMVDYVTIFSESTPYDLIKLLCPDVLVKGGDWRVEDIVGFDIVPDTRSLPFVPGLSTTDIINKIRGKG